MSHPTISEHEANAIGECLALIEGSKRFDHLNASLFSHLVGVWRILKAIGAPSHVITSGLIHSVYSTQFYKEALFSTADRPLIEAAFGRPAERLAYLFCTIDRKDLQEQRGNTRFTAPLLVSNNTTGEKIYLDPTDAEHLLTIECANHIEQGALNERRHHLPFMAWAFSLPQREVSLYPVTVDQRAYQESQECAAIEAYYEALSAERPHMGFHTAALLNPYAAEPLIFVGAAQLMTGDGLRALNSIRNAQRLFSFWATAWDKSLPFLGWNDLAGRLETLCTGHIACPASDIGERVENVCSMRFSL